MSVKSATVYVDCLVVSSRAAICSFSSSFDGDGPLCAGEGAGTRRVKRLVKADCTCFAAAAAARPARVVGCLGSSFVGDLPHMHLLKNHFLTGDGINIVLGNCAGFAAFILFLGVLKVRGKICIFATPLRAGLPPVGHTHALSGACIGNAAVMAGNPGSSPCVALAGTL